MDRRFFCLAAMASATLPTRAAAYPDKPVRVISAYAAGGGPDVQLRQAGPALGAALGQPIVVENKVGAAGVLAAQYVAQQPPDGYTLLMGSNTHLIQKVLQPSLKFDPIADFAPIGNLAASPTVLVVSAESPWKSVAELVAAMKARTGSANYSSGGLGTSAHLAGATLVSLAGLKVTHIPLKGSVEIPLSLLRGDTQFAFPVAGTGVPQVAAGKLRALAVTSRKRLPQLPEVPTLQEALGGNELAVQESWFGLWAPAGTPSPVRDSVFSALRRTVADPAVRSAFEAAGNEATTLGDSPQAFSDFVRSEQRKWTEIVRLTGVTINT
ncbi:MAG: tripartite tricarboxylate transporter substrate-binding protein [Rhodocyclaceae bacterium]|nr:tripartite tricarboxylate transporter substrate-binding protein [Rhodocyclaceae bacterium]MDQ8001949.1 tripartite tricarboxylate transporter substrate-binding protein [Pseudomonadota bacterium]